MTYFHPKEKDKEEASWFRRHELMLRALRERDIDRKEFMARIKQYHLFLSSMPVDYLMGIQQAAFMHDDF